MRRKRPPGTPLPGAVSVAGKLYSQAGDRHRNSAFVLGKSVRFSHARRALTLGYEPGTVRFLLEHASGVDRHGESGDIPRFIGGQKEHRVTDVDWLDPSDGEHVHELSGDGQILLARIL
jgi:hypothetical protein